MLTQYQLNDGVVYESFYLDLLYITFVLGFSVLSDKTTISLCWALRR
jgi:hypothetical protein